MPGTKSIGFLTNKQVKVLKLRAQGYTVRRIASILGVSHQDVALTEKRALKNIELATHTLIAYKIIVSPIKVILREGTRHIDIPALVIEEADKAGIKIKGDVSWILKVIWRKARECIENRQLKKPVLIVIDRDGELEVYPLSKIQKIVQLIEET